MKNKKTEKILIIALIAFIVAAFLFMFKDSIFKGSNKISKTGITTMPEADGCTSEIFRDTTISQTFTCTVDGISDIAVVFTRLYYLDDVEDAELPYISISLMCEDETLMSTMVRIDKIEEQHRTFLESSEPISGLKGKELTLVIHNESYTNTGLALMSNTENMGQFEYNGMKVIGTLCFVVNSK